LIAWSARRKRLKRNLKSPPGGHAVKWKSFLAIFRREIGIGIGIPKRESKPVSPRGISALGFYYSSPGQSMRNDATGVENKCVLSSMPGVGLPHPTGTGIHESESCMYGTNYRTLADSSRTGIGDNWKLGVQDS
jgi:hypothetical protein